MSLIKEAVSRKELSQKANKELSRMRKLGGLIAIIAAFVTVIVVLISGIAEENIINIIIVAALTAVFVLLYYGIPQIYQNKKLVIFPNVAFTIALAFAIYFLGNWGLPYIVFFIIMLVIEAHILNIKQFIFATFLISASLVMVNYLQIGSYYIPNLDTFYYISSFEIFLILSLAITFRLSAQKSLNLQSRRDDLIKGLQQLKEEKKEITNLLDNLDDLIITFDSDKKITFLNKSIKKFFSIEDEKKYLDKKPTDQLSLLTENGEKIRIDKLIKNAKEESIVRKDIYGEKNDKHWSFQAIITPMHEEDKKTVQGYIVFLHALTKEEELERKKVEFASIASHEIRTPLSVIEGYLHLLLFNKEKFKYNKDTEEYLNTLYSSSLGLLQLANDILTITKIEGDKLKINVSEINPKDITKEVKENLSQKAKKKKIKLKVSAKKDLPKVETDPSKVKEIISNLLDNAIKFTQKGEIVLSARKEKDKIAFSIKDSGPGLDKEAKENIFKKFYQAENWQTRKAGGTGLGLYICKSLAKRLGGDVVLEESKVGEGSTFTLYVPIKYPNQKDIDKIKKEELDYFIESF